MSKHAVGVIRNLAVVGHGAAGKTTLVDSLLFKAGAVPRRGSVDDGTSFSDFDDEEHKRHFSIDASVLTADYDGKYFEILDAPGYPDFIGAALGTLNAVETAVIVVNAAHGMEVNARRMFREAGQRGLARFIVLNKLDADNIDFDQLLDTVKQTFGKVAVLYNAPDAVGAKFSKVVPVLDGDASHAKARADLIDAVAESDDALLEKYLADGDLSNDDIHAALPKAIANGACIPIFCLAAKKDVGVAELLKALADYAPSPAVVKPHIAHTESGDKEVVPDENAEFVGQVFKTVFDKFVGHMSFIRIYSGKLKDHATIYNQRTHKSAHLGALLRMQGKEHKTDNEAGPGEIVVVTKIDDFHIGDTLGSSPNVPAIDLPRYPDPMFGLACEPKARGDEQKISTSLHKIAEEDPTFHMTRDAQTHELVVTGISQLHLDVVQARLKKRFDLDIVTHEPKIPYRETIQSKAEGDHRHKKQSGGRGQFGEVHLRIYPLSRDIHSQKDFEEQFANKSNFEKMRHAHYDPNYNFGFIDHIVGGSIPNQFIPAVEKGCHEVLDRGALAGYRVQDIAVEVHFGKDHAVDSSEAAFKTAGRMAFKKAIMAARPVLLEPIVDLEVTVPSKYTGAILGDLNTKRARVDNQDSLPGDLASIHAKAPLAEVTRYAAQLGSITQGQGSYTMSFSHYDVVPANIQQQIVAKAKVQLEEDEE
ncbi:MAG: elongation factor G [Gemmataceae bacterium]|nr:elongation factor G [Gemmataceae bacterium]